MHRLLLVALGGCLGAVARYVISGLVHRGLRIDFPIGTLVVNVSGCLLIGIAMALFHERQLFSPEARVFLLVGVLGSFTTFSTFGYESYTLLADGEITSALCNMATSVVLCIGAVWLGHVAVRSVAG